MTRWRQSPSNEDEFGALLQWHETTDAGHYEHLVAFRPHVETEGKWRIPSALVPRILCHIMINRIPDEGLPELCETLGQMLEFYSSRSMVERLPHEEVIRAEVVAQEERPLFFLMEED